MTPAGRLRDRLPELVRQLEDFARCPRDLVPDLVRHLQRTLTASQGRAKGAAEENQRRAVENEKLIRVAVGALPMANPLRYLAGITQQRMERSGGWVADIKTIRRVLRKMQAELNGKPEPDARLSCGARVNLQPTQF